MHLMDSLTRAWCNSKFQPYCLEQILFRIGNLALSGLERGCPIDTVLDVDVLANLTLADVRPDQGLLVVDLIEHDSTLTMTANTDKATRHYGLPLFPIKPRSVLNLE